MPEEHTSKAYSMQVYKHKRVALHFKHVSHCTYYSTLGSMYCGSTFYSWYTFSPVLPIELLSNACAIKSNILFPNNYEHANNLCNFIFLSFKLSLSQNS